MRQMKSSGFTYPRNVKTNEPQGMDLKFAERFFPCNNVKVDKCIGLEVQKSSSEVALVDLSMLQTTSYNTIAI